METPDHFNNITTRQLPKTAQVISYAAGDDGDYEAGWWLGRQIATNRTRFKAQTIGADDIVTDRATGLIWAGDGNAAGGNFGAAATWANQLIYANGLTFAGFTDWRVPNAYELLSILNFNPGLISNFPEFQNMGGQRWSSTTMRRSTTKAYTVNFASGNANRFAAYLKTLLYKLLCVRGGL